MILQRSFALLLFVMSSMAAQAPHGTVPRAEATAYPMHAEQDGLKIGATLLTHKDLKKALATDVNQCCLVVEVALYPAKSNFVKISLDNFMLREAGMELGARPSTAEVLAARLEVRPGPVDREHRPGVSSSSEIGYERAGGNNPQDPTQRTSSGGVYQRQSVGVGIPIGGSKPQLPEGTTAEGNRRAIEAELKEKGLPEISAWEAVAGYLYFSVPKKSKGGYEFVYTAGDKKVVLPLK